MRLREFRSILVQSGQSWSRHDVPRLSAAISYYAILALAPILVIAVAAATVFLDSESVNKSLKSEVTASLGADAASLVLSILERAAQPLSSVPATIVAFIVAVYAASGLFGQVLDTSRVIWELKPEGHPIRLFLTGRAVSTVVMLGFLLLFLGWLVLDSILGWLTRTANSYLGWPFLSFLVSVVFVTIVFGAAFRALPPGKALWREVWPGAVVTGIGFSIAKLLLSLYFTFSGVAAAYGSAGALLVVLLWIYYSCQVFFFGMEITRTIALQRKPKLQQASLMP
jgi:membrane protein